MEALMSNSGGGSFPHLKMRERRFSCFLSLPPSRPRGKNREQMRDLEEDLERKSGLPSILPAFRRSEDQRGGGRR